MYRVVRILNRLNLGGPTYNAAYLSRYLEPDFQTWLAAGQKKETEASSGHILEKHEVEPVYIDEMSRAITPGRDWKAYQSISHLIQRIKPHIVHTHAAKAGALGRLAAHRHDVPIILHTFHGHVFHSYFSPWKTQLFLAIERYLAGISHRIIAISEQQRQELSQKFRVAPSRKITTIPLGFNLSRFQDKQGQKRTAFRDRYNLKQQEIAIGIVGRLVPVKNHKFFLRGLSQLLRAFPNLRGFIIGDGQWKEKIQQFATELGINWKEGPSIHGDPPNLIFTSWLKEIDEAMAGLDIVTLTSHNEGTPVSLIEAQAAGKPIVTTDVGGVRDTVLPGQSAFIVKKGDLRKLTQKTKTLIDSPSLRQKMGRQGQKHALKHFRYQRLVDDTRQLYEQLIHQQLSNSPRGAKFSEG